LRHREVVGRVRRVHDVEALLVARADAERRADAGGGLSEPRCRPAGDGAGGCWSGCRSEGIRAAADP
jgi:hypothetical protein